MAEKEVRKTTTKKIVRKAALKKVAFKSTASKKLTVAKITKRKAPTNVAAGKAKKKRIDFLLFGGIVVFLLSIGGSVVIGFSDYGQINIDTRISDIKEHATPEERQVIESIPVQKTRLPNGGLVPSGAPAKIVPKLTPVTATTSDAVSATTTIASSTEPIDTNVNENTTGTQGDSKLLEQTSTTTESL